MLESQSDSLVVQKSQSQPSRSSWRINYPCTSSLSPFSFQRTETYEPNNERSIAENDVLERDKEARGEKGRLVTSGNFSTRPRLLVSLQPSEHASIDSVCDRGGDDTASRQNNRENEDRSNDQSNVFNDHQSVQGDYGDNEQSDIDGEDGPHASGSEYDNTPDGGC